jgi:hypothetical protein
MKILDQLPITREHSSLRFGERYLVIHANQILVWVSVHLPGILVPETNIPMFPALLDTGNNFGFSMQDRHLRDWAGIDPGLLENRGDIGIEGKVVPRRAASVWLYSNIPGKQEAANGQSPLRLKLNKGIGVYPPDAVPPGPRLPLLGLPALLENDLDFWLDPERLHVTVQPRNWRRSLIRLLNRV